MPLRDVIAAALSRPAGKIVDGPVRDIINEILAERGYASPAEVSALRDEADALRTNLDTLQTTVEGLSAQLAQLQGQLATLQRAPAAAPLAATDHSRLAPSVPAAPATPLPERAASAVAAAGRGECKADDCTAPSWRDGFCAAHAEAWRAGRLPGFVSPEGLVSVSGEPRRVAPGFSGALYTVESGQVRVGEQLVPSVAY